MTAPARAVWRFLRREGDCYLFAAHVIGPWPPEWSFHHVPVERFWGGAQ